MAKQSAGILLYRREGGQLQFFLVHPGGPFYKKKDGGAWTIPKGEFDENEDAFDAAKREFFEETGQKIDGRFIGLDSVKLKSGKTIYAWAVEGDIDHEIISSNTFEMEWPPKSGRLQSFPEIDRAAWFGWEEARWKIKNAQAGFLDKLAEVLDS
jgi:predicted NUDIX family NTP pyrophosphohydrolase